MKEVSPRVLSVDEQKKAIRDSLKLFVRLLFPVFSIFLLFSLLFFIVLENVISKEMIRPFSFLFACFLMPAVLLTAYDSASGVSVGPETIIKNSIKYFKCSGHFKLGWFENSIALVLILGIAFSFHFIFPQSPQNEYSSFIAEFLLLSGPFFASGFFLKLTLSIVDFSLLLMSVGKVDLKSSVDIEVKAINKNSFLLNYRRHFMMQLMFLVFSSVFHTGLGWIFLPLMLFHYCYLTILYRFIFEGQGIIEDVKEGETVISNAVSSN